MGECWVFGLNAAASDQVCHCFDHVGVGRLGGHKSGTSFILLDLGKIAKLLVWVLRGWKSHRGRLIHLKVESWSVDKGLLEGCVLEEEVVKESLNGVRPHKVHLCFDS